MSPTKAFATRLKLARLNAGLSTRELASRVGYSRAHVLKIEAATERGYNSQIQTVFDFSAALGVSPQYLLGLETNPNAL